MADSGPRTTSVRGIVYARGDLYREALEALRELVRLKDGPRGAAYEKAKPGAWEAARAVLSRAEREPE